MIKQRIQEVRNHLNEKKIDAFLITNSFNIAYLTEFKTLAPSEREAFVLITNKNVFIFSDGRYQAKTSKIFNFKLLTAKNNLIKQLRDTVKKEHINILGFEKEDIKWSEYEAIKKNVAIILLPLDRIIVQLRMIKEENELDAIKKACQLSDQSLHELIPYLKIGKSEKEIAFLLERIIRNKGNELAFDPIIAIDYNTAIPHYDTKNGGGVLNCDSMILIDFGVKYNGYCSDITRMFFTGSISNEKQQNYEVLHKTQKQTIDHIQKFNKLSEIDLYCRRLLKNQQLPTYPHSTGHGLGIEIHEYPKVSTYSNDLVNLNTVFTIEPGIYFPEKWGMRIEDTVCINKKKETVVFTKFPKKLTLL